MPPEYESEFRASREEVVAVLDGVAEGVAAGVVRIGDGSEAVEIEVPDEVTLEVELESEGDTLGLEVELEWPFEEEQRGAAADESAPEPPAAGSERPIPVGPANARETMARFELFRDERDEWRWRLRHRNGNIIAASGEGYSRKHNARKGLMSVRRNAPTAEVTEEQEP